MSKQSQEWPINNLLTLNAIFVLKKCFHDPLAISIEI